MHSGPCAIADGLERDVGGGAQESTRRADVGLFWLEPEYLAGPPSWEAGALPVDQDVRAVPAACTTGDPLIGERTLARKVALI